MAVSTDVPVRSGMPGMIACKWRRCGFIPATPRLGDGGNIQVITEAAGKLHFDVCHRRYQAEVRITQAESDGPRRKLYIYCTSGKHNYK